MSSYLNKPLDEVVAEKRLAKRREGNLNRKRNDKNVNKIQYFKSPRRGGFQFGRFNKRDNELPNRRFFFRERNTSQVLNRGFPSSQKGVRQISFVNANRKNNFVILRISNLDFSILQDDLHELFSSVGEVLKVWLDFDKTDRSEGTGGCIFKDPRDAHRAVRLYNGRIIEGMPIKLEIIEGGSTRESARLERELGTSTGGRFNKTWGDSNGFMVRGEGMRRVRGQMAADGRMGGRSKGIRGGAMRGGNIERNGRGGRRRNYRNDMPWN